MTIIRPTTAAPLEQVKVRPPFRIPITLRLVIALAIWIVVGTALLMLPAMTTQPITLGDALFTATSAATVTGLGVVTTSTTFTLLGQIALMVIIQVGGLGFIVVIAIFLRLRHRHLGLAERLSLTSSMHLDTTENIMFLLMRLTVLTFAIECIGALLLFVHWGLSGIVPPDQLFFYSIFHAISAFCNAGFDLFSGLPQYPNGIPNDNLSLLILGALIILGGLGLPLYVDLLRWGKRRRTGLNTKVTIVVSMILILIGMVALLLAEYRAGGVLTGYELIDRTVQAWFQSVAARTAGFPGLPNFSDIKPESQLTLVFLMFIGTAPASMGGGITTGTFAILVLAGWSCARGRTRVRVGMRTLAITAILRATAVLVISTLSVLVAAWLMLVSSSFSLSEVLFEVTSAFSTTGLTLGITGELNPFGRFIDIAMMFWGRLGAMTLIIAFAQRKKPQELAEYPEVQVLMG